MLRDAVWLWFFFEGDGCGRVEYKIELEALLRLCWAVCRVPRKSSSGRFDQYSIHGPSASL